MNKKITTLYEHYKNTNKKLKIICDWDEVIQVCEPYALWETTNKEALESFDWKDAKLRGASEFPEYFFELLI